MCTIADCIQLGCCIIIRISEINRAADIDSKHRCISHHYTDKKIPARANPGIGF